MTTSHAFRTSPSQPPSVGLNRTADRPWQVLLLGGASGVGKTQVSYRLAHHYAAGLTEVDDVQIVLEQMTTPESLPAVHWWRTHPDQAHVLDDAAILRHTLAYGAVMERVLEPVIANHLDTAAPMLFEGDFILPSLAGRQRFDGVAAGGRVAAVFLYEENEHQIRENYRGREETDQIRRSHISWRYSEWLRTECDRWGISTVPARPWDTVLSRVIRRWTARIPHIPRRKAHACDHGSRRSPTISGGGSWRHLAPPTTPTGSPICWRIPAGLTRCRPGRCP